MRGLAGAKIDYGDPRSCGAQRRARHRDGAESTRRHRVHVDVGTLNYGGAIHTAWRGNYPVLITAGTGPRAYPGSMIGARNSPVQWVQEPRDQGGIVRQYTKVDHRLEHQDNPGMMISRLLQIAMSEPKGRPISPSRVKPRC